MGVWACGIWNLHYYGLRANDESYILGANSCDPSDPEGGLHTVRGSRVSPGMLYAVFGARGLSSLSPLSPLSLCPSPLHSVSLLCLFVARMQVGEVVRADVMTKQDGRSSGCGIVEFGSPEEVQ